MKKVLIVIVMLSLGWHAATQQPSLYLGYNLSEVTNSGKDILGMKVIRLKV